MVNRLVLIIVINLIICGNIYGQINYFGVWSSITLTDNRELHTSSYTLINPGVTGDLPGGAVNINSYVPSGTSASIIFPLGTNLTNVTNITLTTGSGTYNVPTIPSGVPYAVIFTMPVFLNRSAGFTMVIPNVINPTINIACGALSNSYYSGTCADHIQVYMENATGGGVNVYHHSGTPRYNIIASDYFVDQVIVEKPILSGVPTGFIDNEMIRVNVRVRGSIPIPISTSSILFSTTGTTNTNDIISASIWFTGSNAFFHASGEVLLGTIVNPGATVSSSFIQNLQQGNNYFWLEYDTQCDQLSLGRLLSAEFQNMVINSTHYTSTTPPGSRAIVQNYTSAGTNLITNPGFETFSSCPSGITTPASNEIIKATGWNMLSFNTGGTADYFNTCATNPTVMVPTSSLNGHQVPHSGNAYAGIIPSNINGTHPFTEYITTQLLTPLMQDSIYVLSMYVVSAEDSGPSSVIAKSNGLGGYFSNTLLTQPGANRLVQNPQANFPGVIWDENDWVFVSDTFIATGNEQYLTIGNFLGVGLNQHITTGTGNSVAYWLIDDVQLSLLSQINIPCPITPLPVQLVNFTGKEIKQGILLEWTTMSEINNQMFEIERSADAINFEKIGYVNGNGNSNTEINYSLVDKNVSNGIYYYRLRQIDFDGQSHISNIIAVWINQLNQDNFSVYRNGQKEICVSGNTENIDLFTILSVDGKTIVSSNTYNQCISIERSGIYFVQIYTKNQQVYSWKIQVD